MNKIEKSQTTNISSSPFYQAYLNFRKKLESDNFTDEEWIEVFEIKREKAVIRHPEDFENFRSVR